MSEYTVTCDVCELPRDSQLIVIPGPVEPGDLALLDIEGWLIPGRWNGVDELELPDLILELGEALSFRVIGPVIQVKPETAFDRLN
jgi:hypothetical protein